MSNKKTSKTEKTKVTRIKASDSSAKKTPKKTVIKAKSEVKKAVSTKKPSSKKSTPRKEKKVGYFKGAWYELRQVRWPNRKNTWMLTGAVISYSVVIATIILLLDLGFNELFKILITK